jgi:hypothetical protein
MEITTTSFGMVLFYYRNIVGLESRHLKNGCRFACEESIPAYKHDIANFLFHISFLHAKYLLTTIAGLHHSSVLSPKNKVINKQNAKHVYTEQQIHFPNFTLARAYGHLNFIQKPAKKSPSSS